MSYDSSRARAHSAISPDGSLADLEGSSNLVSGFQWDPVSGRIFSIVPTQPPGLSRRTLGQDGTLGQESNLAFGDRSHFAEPLRISPDGLTLVTGAGAVLDPNVTNLNNQFVALLPHGFTDARWRGADLVTLHANSASTCRVELFPDGATTAAAGTDIEGTPVALLADGPSWIAVTVDRGSPRFWLLEDDLSISYASPPVPSPPQEAEFVQIGDESVRLTWLASSDGATSYVVEARAVTIPESDWLDVASVGSDMTEAVATGLTPNTDYEFRVRGANISGRSLPTAPISTRTFPAPGGGNYGPPLTLFLSSEAVNDLHFASFGPDTELDLIVAEGRNQTVQIFEKATNVQPFTPDQRTIVSSLDGPRDPVDCATTDFDGDDLADVITVFRETGTIVWQENRTDQIPSRFSSNMRPIDDSLPDASGVLTADFDGDGDTDVVGATPGAVYYYENTGGGAFPSRRELRTASGAVGERSVQLATADIDGDGDFDLVTASPADGDIVVFVNGDGGLALGTEVASGLAGPYDLEVADLDGDGWQDITVGNAGDGTIKCYFGQAGAFPDNASYDALAVGLLDLEVVDWDLDGDDDLLFSTSDNWIGSLENFGGRNFGPPRVEGIVTASPVDIELNDADDDGDPDIIFASRPAARLVG